MRVCMVGTGTNAIPPVKGVSALEKLEFEISKELVKMGNDSKIIDIKPGQKKINGIDFERVSSFTIKGFGKFSIAFKELVFGFFALLRAIKIRKNVEVFHIHTVTPAFVFNFFRFILRKPIVYSSNNPDWIIDDKNLPLGNRIMKDLERFVIKRSSVATAVTESTKSPMTKIRKDIIVINNFVEPDFFRRNERTGFRKEKKIPADAILISFVGKLTENKGIDILLEAAKEVIGKNKNVFFVLAGPATLSGDGKNKWEEVAKDYGISKNIIFTGAVSAKEIVNIHSAANIYVHPTRKEAQSLAVMEAMSMGLPVIASNILGMDSMVDSSNGILVPKEDAKKLAEAIDFLIENPEKRKKMGEKSREKVLKHFTPKKITGEYLEAYRKALKQ